MRWPIQQKILLAFGLAVSTLIGISILSYYNARESIDTQQLVVHTYEVLAELEAILSSIKDAETGQRGYLLTGRLPYLEPYRTALSQSDRHLSRAKALTANNPSQQKRLAALEPLVVHKLAELEETITLRQSKGFEAAMAVVESDRGKQVMDQIRQAINDMKGEEEQFVMRRRSHAEALAQTSKAIIIAGDLLALVIISGAGLLFQREMTRRARAEEAARKHAHELAETNNELQSEIGERKRVEDELRRTETFLASLVNNIPDMIFAKDPAELRFVLFNKAAEELLGYTRAEMIGKNDYDFFPRDEADFFTNKDREVLTTGQLLDIPEESIQTRHKGGRLLHTKKIPLLDEQGSPLYLVGISEDITERKRLEKEKENLIVQLQNSLARLKTLEGILPICAHCKKIRDEQDEWQPVEVYVGVRTNVDFSHGICPTCLNQHYPQFGSGDLSPRT